MKRWFIYGAMVIIGFCILRGSIQWVYQYITGSDNVMVYGDGNHVIIHSAPLASEPLKLKSVRSELKLPDKSVLLSRPDLIKSIEEHFTHNASNSTTIALVNLVGIGGAGKTTLARLYGREYGKKYPNASIYEINAETSLSLSNSFQGLAIALAQTSQQRKEIEFINQIQNIEEQEKQRINFVRNQLKESERWILIFDNVTTYKIIKNYLPQNQHVWGQGRIIITSKNTYIKNADTMNKDNVIVLGELSQEERLKLFVRCRFRCDLDQLPARKKKNAQEFLEQIPPFPLDIPLAAKYIASHQLSYAEYLQQLNEPSQEFNTLQESLLTEMSEYTKTRYSIITLAVQRIMEIDKSFTDLLVLISLLDSNNIPKELLDKVHNHNKTGEFIRVLKQQSLITNESWIENLSTFSLHRSTQGLCRIYLTQRLNLNTDKRLLHELSTGLEKYLNENLDKENLTKMRLLTPHCIAFFNRPLIPSSVRGNGEFALGCMHYHLGEDVKAKQFLEKSLTVLQGPKNLVKKVKAFTYLGDIYRDFGNFKRAKELLEKTLSIYKKEFPEQHINIARTLANLGNVYKDLCDPKKAKEVLEESLLIYERHPENTIGLSRVLAYLGTVYRELGDYKRAQELLERSVNTSKNRSDNPLGHALALARLGNLYRELTYYKEAENCLQQSLDVYTKNSLKNNINIGWVLSYLGLIYKDIGDYNKAKELLKNGILIHKSNCPENNINLAWVLTYLGDVYLSLNEYENARDCLEESLSIYQKNFPTNHINIGWVGLYLSAVYEHLNQYTQANSLRCQSASIYKKYFNEHNIYITWVFPYLGDIYRQSFRATQATIVNDGLLALYQKNYGDSHSRTGLVLKNLGDICLVEGLIEKAEICLNKALLILTENNHFDRHRVLESLGELYKYKADVAMQNAHYNESVIYKQKAKESFKKALLIIQDVCPKKSMYIQRIQREFTND